MIKPVDTPKVGPIDAEARAMFERVLAEKPLSIFVFYETGKEFDMQWIPRLESVRIGMVYSLMRTQMESDDESD